MTPKTTDFLQDLLQATLFEAQCMRNNAHNHEPTTREYWRQREQSALDALTELAYIPIQ